MHSTVIARSIPYRFGGSHSRDKLPVLDHSASGTPPFRHKLLLIYRRCRYFLILTILTYCCPRYIFFAQDGRRKGGMPVAEVIQNRPFIRVGRYGHFRTKWTSQKDFIYPDSQTARFFNNLRKIVEKSAFLHENAQ